MACDVTVNCVDLTKYAGEVFFSVTSRQRRTRVFAKDTMQCVPAGVERRKQLIVNGLLQGTYMNDETG